MYGSQFSGEKQFENPIHGCQYIKQKLSLFLLQHPVVLPQIKVTKWTKRQQEYVISQGNWLVPNLSMAEFFLLFSSRQRK